jgi:hypothetical protein
VLGRGACLEGWNFFISISCFFFDGIGMIRSGSCSKSESEMGVARCL